MKRNLKKNEAINTRYNPSVIAKASTAGITLISLVVTIIVLIILAGVSIRLILEDNGIVTKAKQGKQNMEIAQREEEQMLNTLTNYVENEGKVIIEGPVAGGSYDNPYIPAGFTHTEGEGTWNSGYIIRDSIGNEFVWVPCVLEENRDDIKAGDKVETFKKTLPSTTATTDRYYKYNNYNLTITGEEGTSASEIETSVGIYGGFYIARYEAGIEGTTENYLLGEKTPTTTKPLSQKGKGLWNNITRREAITVSTNMVDIASTGVKSALISGACWDTTLQWMVNSSDNSANEPNIGYDRDSTGNGWYNSESNNTRHVTGYYSVNNIYDMAGNVWEWTTENCTYNESSCVVNRGGSFGDSSSYAPVSFRYPANDYASNYSSFRVVLYKSV